MNGTNTSHVLVVEPDRAIRELMTEALGNAGLAVVAVSSAEIASEVARIAPPLALVVDYVLPRKTGAALVQQLREEMGRGAPATVLLTASLYTVPEEARELFDAELTKPFRIDDLVGAVREAVRAKRRRQEPLSGVHRRLPERDWIHRRASGG